MATIIMKGVGEVDAIANDIRNAVLKEGASNSLIDLSVRTLGEEKVIIFVFEKYYWRASNMTSMTVIVSNVGENVYVKAISTGGSGGIIKFSWGAESSFVSIVEKALKGLGFTTESQDLNM